MTELSKNNSRLKHAYVKWARRYVHSFSKDKNVKQDLEYIDSLPDGLYDWELIICPHVNRNRFNYISKFSVDYKLGGKIHFAIRKKEFEYEDF